MNRKDETKSFFRSEAISAQQHSIFGQITLSRPFSIKFVLTLIVIFTIFLVFLINSAMYTPQATVAGILAPDTGVITVISPVDGVVLEKKCKIGDHVNAGEQLYIITSEKKFNSSREENSMGALNLALENLKQRQKNIELQMEAVKIESSNQIEKMARSKSLFKISLLKINEEISIQEERLNIAEQQFLLNVESQNKGFISISALQQRKIELLDQKARLSNLERNKISILAEKSQAKEDEISIGNRLSLDIARLDHQRLEIASQLNKIQSDERTVLTAPRSGIISSVLIEPGQAVAKQPVLDIIPDNSRLEAQVYLSAEVVAYARKGGLIKLKLPNVESDKGNLIGEIISVSSSTTPIPADLLTQNLSSYNRQTKDGYLVRIKLPVQSITMKNRIIELKSGMMLVANIEYEKRSLLNLLFPAKDEEI